MYFEVKGDNLGLPQHLAVDFRMRYISGNSSSAISAGRAPAGVSIAMANSVGISLWIGQDSLFLESSNQVIGDRTILRDTDNALHFYRIVIDGVNVGSAVTVWQDNEQILTGQTFSSQLAHGLVPRVSFGDESILAQGVSEWQSFNVSAVPESSTAVLAACVLLVLALRHRSSPCGCGTAAA